MSISKTFQVDQDSIKRFIAILGDASVEVRSNKHANHDFFLRAYEFITDYIDGGLFKKEELIIKALEDGGFSPSQGPIAALTADREKSIEMGNALIDVVKLWQGGDEKARMDVGWACREYTNVLGQHLERLKTLIFPLVEQTITEQEEESMSQAVKNFVFEGKLKDGAESYLKMVGDLELEFKGWK